MENLEKKELFLIEEYKSAIQLTFHIDSLRNKLTSFYISVAGLAITGLLFILKKEQLDFDKGEISELISSLLFLIAFIGHLFICVLAKIRRNQLEHFGIINNMRNYFYGCDYNFWNVTQLSNKTLPKPNPLSGTFFWLMIIQVINVAILYLGILVAQNKLGEFSSCSCIVAFIITCVLSFGFQNVIYFYFARPPKKEVYSETNLPY